ncbi:MAG TPA: Flp family type IVb pilin [Clostridia bacterium]|nr:Flp family type IVb pilin [Clostridia bacterium]
MKALLLNTFRSLHQDDSGQDLIEYALVAALIALAATAGMSKLAVGINKAFEDISTSLNNAVKPPTP